MSEKKKWRFETWMLGALIVPIGLGIAIHSFLQRDSVEIGGECSDREQCRAPADACMSVGERQVCTVECGSGCPAGLECVEMNVTLQNSAGFHDLNGVRYCLPHDLAARGG
jgi:hypothetical protein